MSWPPTIPCSTVCGRPTSSPGAATAIRSSCAGELAAAVELGRLTRAFTYHRLAAGLPKPLHPIVDGGAEGWTDVFLGVE